MLTKARPSLLLACLGPAALLGGVPEAIIPEPAAKARFIVGVMTRVQWPQGSRGADPGQTFRIGVLVKSDHSEVAPYLAQELRGTPVLAGRPVRISLMRTLDHIDQCEVLYVEGPYLEQSMKILRNLAGKPVLTIASSPGAAQRGIMLNVFISNERPAYEINRAAIRSAGLKEASQLLLHGTIISG